MDRQVQVTKDGYLIAEMTFNYDTQVSGKVGVTQYAVTDIPDTDIKSVIPVRRYEVPFQHGAMSTIEEIQQYDAALLQKQSEPLPAGLEFAYGLLDYRYVLGNPTVDLMGIGDIQVDFTHNKKVFHLISSRNINEDFSAATNAFESNVVFMKRLFEERLSEFLMELKQVNLN